jgi:DNA-binding NtrC family response regulator
MNKKLLALSLAALDDLKVYSWPGNVRELQNCIERAVILCDGDAIQPRHLNLSFRVAPAAPAETSPWDQIDLSGTLADALKRVSTEVERRKIEQALREAGNNRQRAADLLQVSYKTLLQKQKEYQIEETPA